MAPASTEDEILDLTRPTNAGKVKPDMRLDPELLRGSALRQSLPGFLERIARANQELDTNGAGAGFELTDEEAASKQHIEMNVYAGVMKQSKKRGHTGIKLPIHADNEDDGNSTAASSGGSDVDSNVSEPEADKDGEASSSDESIAASSINVRQLGHSKKRKASSPSHPDAVGNPPRKIRIAAARAPSPALSAHSSSSSLSGSSVGSTRIIRIKVPSKSPEPEDSDGSSSSASAGRNIITLKDPRRTPSPRAARRSTPSSIIKLKASGVSPSEKESGAHQPPSDLDPSSPGRRIRIKVVSPRS